MKLRVDLVDLTDAPPKKMSQNSLQHVMGIVKSQWKYPVKSMRGQRVARMRWDKRGVVGDRVFALKTEDGGFASGKTTRRFRKFDGLLNLAAMSVDDEPPLIYLPDGRELFAGDPQLDEALTSTFGQSLQVSRETTVPHFDAAAVHLVTTASLNWLAAELPSAAIDERRFRPNLVIEADVPAFAEHFWIGGTLTIGNGLTLEVTGRCTRCAMVTFQQEALPPEPRLLRALARDNDMQFGIYAEVRTPGVSEVGDQVSVILD